jgi:hypothetical protein
VRLSEATVLLVADGAGMSGGAQAAELALRELSETARQANFSDPASWSAMLTAADDALSRGAGQCAIVAAPIEADRIVGAGVDDCGAWLISENGIEDLTADQVRKPLLGSGKAVPIALFGVRRSFSRPMVSSVHAPRPHRGCSDRR